MRFEVHRILLSFEFAKSLHSSDTSLYCPETARRPALGRHLKIRNVVYFHGINSEGAHKNLTRRAYSTV